MFFFYLYRIGVVYSKMYFKNFVKRISNTIFVKLKIH